MGSPATRLATAVGMALAERGRRTGGIVYTVLSDGEVQEGSTWEAIMMASSLKLTNLVAFIDNNDFSMFQQGPEITEVTDYCTILFKYLLCLLLCL